MKRIETRGGSDYEKGIDAVLAEIGPTRISELRWFVDVFEHTGELTTAQARRWRLRLDLRAGSEVGAGRSGGDGPR